MRIKGKKALVLAMMLVPLMSNSVWADEAELLQRIERLERIVKGQGLVSLLGRVDQLQNEVQRLNGDNESLRHELETMQRRQRELYLDLDQRLQAQPVMTQVPVIESDTTVVESVTTTEVVQQSTNGQSSISEQETVETTVEATTETLPVAVENGEAAYQAALQTLRSGQYEEAAVALAAFPEQYPNSSYLPNAYYWQGEDNYVLRNFDVAIAAFQTVIDQFPASSKVKDAMLKQGFSQYEQGQTEAAQATLTMVIQQYPNTSAARLAKVRLDRMKQANR